MLRPSCANVGPDVRAGATLPRFTTFELTRKILAKVAFAHGVARLRLRYALIG